MESKELKIKIIEAGKKAVAQLIKVAKEDIIKYDADDELEGWRTIFLLSMDKRKWI